MKAWKLELDELKKGVPVVLSEEEQGWSFADQVDLVESTLSKMKWSSRVPGSGAVEHVLIAAMQDMENMGYDVHEAEALISKGLEIVENDDIPAMAALGSRVLHLLNNAKKIENHPYWNYTVYDSFDKVKEKVNFPTYVYDETDEKYLERTYAGWIAQICAGSAGTCIEGFTTENIRKAFGEVHGYVRNPNTFNDDITYEYAFLKALESAGEKITAADIAEQWVALVPFGWSAEEIALRNIKLGIYPPQSGYMNNPYREWIGAQMRGAVCGQVAPGNPQEAARLAFMDGTVSHFNNGVLGEVFNAVMVSLAYVEKDVRSIVRLAIKMIPNDSEYYSVVNFALECCIKNDHWELAWKECEKRYERYNWIHAYPNAAAEVIALWFGEGDYEKTIHICCMEGYDVDCNAAQIATVIGVMNGKDSVGASWVDPIGDVLNTYLRGLPTLSIRELSEWTVALGKRLRCKVKS